MSKKKAIAKKPIQSKQRPVKSNVAARKVSLLPWMFLGGAVTALCLFPMLKNDFTNWDDEFYVINNALLRGPDWKGIFSEAVVGNYHPLTIISLAINYQISDLTPFSYLLLNLLLHLTNTCLVFYFIWLISGNKIWVAFLTALVFGIHPMHVESVAWISERKDVLYSLFFLLSLIQYWRFLESGSRGKFWISFSLFLLALLSKPAAIILPFVLLLLDYWKGRPIRGAALIEKIPFFALSVLFGIITMQVQTKALVGFAFFPLWQRLFFACYVMMIYFIRFFIPYPLSAFYPYPSPGHLGWPIFISPVFIIVLLAFSWYQRKNKLVVFGILFFVINLLLVSQLISIGLTIVSERYTYVPYIGLGFIFSMWLNDYSKTSFKFLRWVVPAFFAFVFGAMTFQRTQVWRNSGTLWTDVIRQYPDAPYARTNRANYTAKKALDPMYRDQRDSLYKQAVEDCNIALKVNPDLAKGYEQRALIYSDLNKRKEAFDDANSLVRLDPQNRLGYYIRGNLFAQQNNIEKAFADFNKALSISPDYHQVLNNRGTLFLNYYKKYSEALHDFNRAIDLSPQGNYYLNRSICYYKMGDLQNAKKDAQIALQKGTSVPANYRQLLNL
ncbi:MAG TPA: tetratricopeptide repeat protein [Chitinophagaceae bacterium]|nr:tetratricopeptide repeat protein [Chitinophagaceae bacterium]